MSDELQRFQNTLGYLTDQLVRGWSSYLVAKQLNRQYQATKFTSAGYFFTASYRSAMESTILALSRMLNHNSQSLTFPYLINLAEQHTSLFPYANSQIVLSTVREHRSRLEEYKLLQQNLRTQRDKILAHLDREFTNNPSVISSISALDMRDVEKIYRFLLDAINKYKNYFESSELYLEGLEAGIEEDIDYVFGLIAQANSRD